MARGRLITIEGLDGAGKTTLAQALMPELEWRGVGAERLREPGGVELSERIRGLVSDPELEVGARAEALLFAAARAELVEGVIGPALEAGRVVVSDRFLDSSLAYQGVARGLGVEAVERINRFATGGVEPDLTLLLELDPAAAAARSGEADRLEQEGAQLQERVRTAYAQLAERDPQRWRRIAADRPPDQVHADVLAAVRAARERP